MMMPVMRWVPLVLVLAACSNNAVDQSQLKALSGLTSLLKKKEPGITAEQIKARLTPEVRAQFGGAPLLVATVENPRFASVLYGTGENGGTITYFTPDRVSLSFQDGVLVATRGLGFDLMAADVAQTRHALAQRGGVSHRTHRTLDGDNTALTHSFTCDIAKDAKGRILESCTGAEHQFQNTYLYDKAGQMVYSRQWIGPKRGYILIERP